MPRLSSHASSQAWMRCWIQGREGCESIRVVVAGVPLLCGRLVSAASLGVGAKSLPQSLFLGGCRPTPC
jgi:hypothetical protein